MVIDDETVSRRHALLERDGQPRVPARPRQRQRDVRQRRAHRAPRPPAPTTSSRSATTRSRGSSPSESATETLQVGPSSRGGPDLNASGRRRRWRSCRRTASCRKPQAANLRAGHELDGFLSFEHGFLPAGAAAHRRCRPRTRRGTRWSTRCPSSSASSSCAPRSTGCRSWRRTPDALPDPLPPARLDDAGRLRARLPLRADRPAAGAARLHPAALDGGVAAAGQGHPGGLLHRPVLLQLAAARPVRAAAPAQPRPARPRLGQRRRARLLPRHDRVRDGAHAGPARHDRRAGGRRGRRPRRGWRPPSRCSSSASSTSPARSTRSWTPTC